MIGAIELMVNNIVRNGDGKFDRVVSISDTDSGYANCCLKKRGNGEKDFNPVKITYKRLVKLGYSVENIETTGRMVTRRGSIILLEEQDNGGFLARHVEDIRILIRPRLLYYIHEVQNLHYWVHEEELLGSL